MLEGPAEDLAHALKYEGWRELAQPMSRAMAHEFGGRPDLVIPVPTTARNEQRRGYNQAALLADGVAHELHCEQRVALRRNRSSPSQTTLTPEQRRRNVEGVFSLDPIYRQEVMGAEVLLVDDVLTTGATASEAAVTLAAAGARSVVLLAFARALPARHRSAA